MGVTRTEPGNVVTGPVRRDVVRLEDDPSVGELVTRLAEEGKELAAVELRRLRVEIEEKARDVGERAELGVAATVAGAVSLVLSLLMGLALAVGIFLALGRAFDDYTISAFVTGGIMFVSALVMALVARKLFRRMIGSRDPDRKDPTNGRGRLTHGA